MIFFKRIIAYPNKAPNTKIIQDMSQADIAVSPSTLGDLSIVVLKILINTKKTVTRKLNRLETDSVGIKKLA